MTTRRWFILLLALFNLLVLAAPAGAQALQAYAAVVDGELVIFNPDGTSTTINNPPHRSFFDIEWSPDGTLLAYQMYDDSYQLRLMVTDATASTVTLLNAGPLEAGFPLAWTPDGQLLYVAQGTFQPDAPYQVQFQRIAPQASAAPETLGTAEFGVGCGGGSTLPADWQYWDETVGFGGFFLTLEWTDFGILYSTTCGGVGLALFDPATGSSRVIGPSYQLGENSRDGDPLSRVKLSPDGQRAAALRVNTSTNPRTVTLTIVDLATGGLGDIPTNGQPDQLAWGIDGTLFYSTREARGSLSETLSAEQAAAINAAVGYDLIGEMVDLSNYEVSVWQMNPNIPDAVRLVYRADAYAIGRMQAAFDGLFISQIANLGGWLAGIADGTIDIMADESGSQQRAAVPVSVYRLDLNGGADLMKASARQFVLRPMQ